MCGLVMWYFPCDHHNYFVPYSTAFGDNENSRGFSVNLASEWVELSYWVIRMYKDSRMFNLLESACSFFLDAWTYSTKEL